MLSPPKMGDIPQGPQGIRDRDDRLSLQLSGVLGAQGYVLNDDPLSPLRHGLLHELMPIEPCPPQGDEQIPSFDGPRVDGDPTEYLSGIPS